VIDQTVRQFKVRGSITTQYEGELTWSAYDDSYS